MSWNPKTHPYRVTWHEHGAHLPDGWGTHSKTFRSFAEAKSALDKFFGPQIAFASLDHVDDGVVPDAWRWALLRTRKRKHPAQMTSAGREHERAVTS